jgi:hypothetical protein
VSKINIGCGISPTPGWENYDNSFSLVVVRFPILKKILKLLGLLNEAQLRAIKYHESSPVIVKRANAARAIPKADRSVRVIYTSHMLEHLDREDALAFLREAIRVLSPGGIIRISVPDLLKITNEYVSSGDADQFMQRLSIISPKPKTWRHAINHLLVGARRHQCMYDAVSLCRLLTSAGFKNPTVLPPGRTTIPDPGELNLYERSDESLYVEAHVS